MLWLLLLLLVAAAAATAAFSDRLNKPTFRGSMCKTNGVLYKENHNQRQCKPNLFRRPAGSAALPLSAQNDDDNDLSPPSPTTLTIRKVLDQLKDSEFIQQQHLLHKESPTVTHLFKATPLVQAPSKWKLLFVNSWAGKMVDTIMAEEQSYLGDWKIDKILDAAGDYDARSVRSQIDSDVASHQIVVYSFVDCPWCVATKDLLLRQEPYNQNSIRFIELEDLGVTGKHVRAELAKLTQRTSMPCIFVNGQPIGGYTDGAPIGPGLLTLHESGELEKLIKNKNGCSSSSGSNSKSQQIEKDCA